VPDPRWGNQVTALVVPSDGADLTEGELAAHVGERLAGYKRPRSIRVVVDLQRTASGKIDRRWAREQAERLFSPPAGDG
jgi:acyl-CoA synthetase (AMP-forming)/AMP-acid ligase II